MSRVSVVITHWNYARFIDQCLLSIRRQTFTDYEIVAVDDGSCPADRDIFLFTAKQHSVQKVLTLGSNTGTLQASNLGVRLAESEYCVLVNADDWVAPTFLERLVSALDSQELSENNVAMAYSDFWHVFPDHNHPVYFPDWNVNRLRRMNYILCSAMFKRSVFMALGGFQDNHGLEDYGLWLSMALEGFNGVHVSEPLYFYRAHDTNRSHRVDAGREIKRVHDRLGIQSEEDDLQRLWTEYTIEKQIQTVLFGISIQLALKLFSLVRERNPNRIAEVGVSFASMAIAQGLITKLEPTSIDIYDAESLESHIAWFESVQMPTQLRLCPSVDEYDYDLIVLDLGDAACRSEWIVSMMEHVAISGCLIVDDLHFLDVQAGLVMLKDAYGPAVKITPLMDTKDQHGRLAGMVEWVPDKLGG